MSQSASKHKGKSTNGSPKQPKTNGGNSSPSTNGGGNTSPSTNGGQGNSPANNNGNQPNTNNGSQNVPTSPTYPLNPLGPNEPANNANDNNYVPLPNLGPSNYQPSEQKPSSSSETFGSNTIASLFNRFVKPEIAPQTSLTSQSDQQDMDTLIGSLNAENGTPASNSDEGLAVSPNISSSSVTSPVSTSSSASSVAVSSARASSSAKQQKQSNASQSSTEASAPLAGLGLAPIVPKFVNWPMSTPVSGYVNQASPNYGAGYQPETENRNVSPLAPSNYQPQSYYQGNGAGANEPVYTPANDYGLVRSGRHVRPVNVAKQHGRYLHRRASYRRVPYFIVLKRGVRLHSASNFRHGYVKAVIRAHSATFGSPALLGITA